MKKGQSDCFTEKMEDSLIHSMALEDTFGNIRYLLNVIGVQVS